MSNFTNAPALLEALEQLDRLRADPELMELDRQRRLAMFDQMAINAAQAKGMADSIVQLLTLRFSIVSQEIQFKLLALRDVEELERLVTLAFNSGSLEEFASHLP